MRDYFGKMIVFCSLMFIYFNNVIFVDLIRWLFELDLFLMDGLYFYMLLWSKEKGYKVFNMGMVIFLNVG